MAALFNGLKRYLYKHSNIVDLMLASLIICLCLIVLMPKVHDSFKSNSRNGDQPAPGKQPSVGLAARNQTVDATKTTTTTIRLADSDEHEHEHEHQHSLPVGEIIICLGFFLFYCVGLGISDGKKDPLAQAALKHGGPSRKVSTKCCPTTGCSASSQPAANQTISSVGSGHSRELGGAIRGRRRDDPAEVSTLLLTGANADDSGEADSCVLFLNAHHVHHTHDSHSHPARHQHATNKPANGTNNKKYGATATRAQFVADNQARPKLAPSADQVEEIQITRVGLVQSDPNFTGQLTWPRSVKVAALGVTLALILILFDFKVEGFMEMKKAFLAASTGALLYLALFLVMPRGPPGCHSCNDEEEVVTHIVE